jgi:hypothetical protein
MEKTFPAKEVSVESAKQKGNSRLTKPGRTVVSTVHKAGFLPVRSFVKSKRKLPHWQLPGSVYFVTLAAKPGIEFTNEERDVILGACRYWERKKLTLHAAVVMPDHVHLLMQPLEIQTTRSGRTIVPIVPGKVTVPIVSGRVTVPIVSGRVTVPVVPGKTTSPVARYKRDACTTKKRPCVYSLSEITHSIKSYTAHEINKVRNRRGNVWTHESYDRIVRDDEEFEEKLNYILNNPLKTGIADEEGHYEWLYLPEKAE